MPNRPDYINGDACHVMTGYPEDRTTTEAISYVFSHSTLGVLLLATSEKGVATVLLGADTVPLTKLLRERFPLADVQPGHWPEDELAMRVVHFIERPSRGLNVPLDLRGSRFQHRVWEIIRDIPIGETSTYAAIARQVGAPTDEYAVGLACAANELAVVVPCHRVVDEGAQLGSRYRWGRSRQMVLLAREKATFDDKTAEREALNGVLLP
ncbi:methylated-DNA--[protein]-cysteine S-methyltransferase [Rhizobium calliandrae]|uniref:Methylated-DNA--[protein]-cysteine S-methyltransferase n=1 Tax=Rhizobium calliandrae TaxID=1312182 RepID=A0ABT7KR14_9HYPH|nr:methylated-DNA--[protein]-cysteine S-methyltransferase [Rhizobium calliandrae]MDL2409718.1 methylated-DNA--[protein]-cysteine S-methyltransferase [Rhizobium calliandrae]